MSKNVNTEIRAYLMSGAGGTFAGVDAYDCLMRALAHSKIECSGEQFATSLKAHGIVPDQRGDGFVLVLPTASR